MRHVVISLWTAAATLDAAIALGEDAPPAGVQPVEVVRKISGPATVMAVSPDGQWLAVADGLTNEVVLFSTKDARRSVVARREGERFFWNRLVFTRDSAFLAVEPLPDDSGACVVPVIDVGQAKETLSIDCSAPPQDRERGFWEIVPDSRESRFLVRRFHVTESWDARTGAHWRSFDSDSDASHVYATRDPDTVVEDHVEEIEVVRKSRGAHGWKIDSAPEVAAPKGRKPDEAVHDRRADVAGVTTDGRFLVVRWQWKRGPKGNDASGEVRQATVYSMKDGKVLWTRETSSGTRAVAAGDGVVALIAVGAEKEVEFFDAATGKARGAAVLASAPMNIVSTSDGRAFWVGSLHGEISSVAPPAAPK